MAGMVSIYAASYDFDHANMLSFTEFSGKQFRWIGLSLVLGLVLLLIDVRVYENYAYVIYGTVLLLLLITIFIAPNTKGSHSWLVLGPMSLQPAEFGKFSTALCLAKLFSSYNFVLNASRKNYMLALMIIFMPVILILAQNETGSALVYLSLFFVLYREGMSGLVLLAALCAVTFFVVAVKFTGSMLLGIPSGQAAVFIMIMVLIVAMLAVYCKEFTAARNVFLWFAGTGIAVTVLEICGVEVPGTIFFIAVIMAALAYCVLLMFKTTARKLVITVATALSAIVFLFSVNYAFTSILQRHQQMRIKVALGMEEDLRGAGYNVNQSKIAIGSGGLWGKGFLNGTQTKLKYVPEQHTDFIFCTVGEEEGLWGSATVILLFLILILRIINIAERQPTVFGRVYAYCVASYLIFHISINIGMVIGLCPVIGIPLPFFSYGGSSLWGFTFLLFILLRIDASRRERSF
ncbi:rod shape-determining protein RodA [Muribaculaceae bacterium Isolate-039 (Harlan)]|jgi:rod shape determining protein RodA|uniref:Cell wall polymerase n=2 Tax=Duncaniella muris TaxID=2094150 RepID=A0A2V1IUK6_9BACT|nr:rod shape-determining protein RodA [Muribaculaceae bacterium S4]NBI20593.1 rod shape-determining protein RodA [Muribaculaceae bacterium Z1]PWB04492.1 rod shape-determining protein RodA [Duncaniella muris]QCD40796.1 rod shape-determining protein RodA [Duncaniella sp. C9]QCP73697.1 rod shape-determining protein RodA [Duncaniella sp. B8]ROS91702.1 rod shape-determining protein RodA [Muribaculaceae bacterium Isolate-039 (Harlan)]ROS97395.1 rod shape-determining protein RodA [Muribaculaceae bac